MKRGTYEIGVNERGGGVVCALRCLFLVGFRGRVNVDINVLCFYLLRPTCYLFLIGVLRRDGMGVQ